MTATRYPLSGNTTPSEVGSRQFSGFGSLTSFASTPTPPSQAQSVVVTNGGYLYDDGVPPQSGGGSWVDIYFYKYAGKAAVLTSMLVPDWGYLLAVTCVTASGGVGSAIDDGSAPAYADLASTSGYRTADGVVANDQWHRARVEFAADGTSQVKLFLGSNLKGTTPDYTITGWNLAAANVTNASGGGVVVIGDLSTMTDAISRFGDAYYGLTADTPPNRNVTVQHGSGTGTVTIGGTATGHRTRAGQATGAVTVSGSAAGHANRTGSATGTVTIGGTATGHRTRAGQATGAVTVSGSAAGHANRTGSATGTVTIGGTAAGHADASGAASGSGIGEVIIGGSASGYATKTSTATGTVTIGGSVNGSAFSSDEMWGDPVYWPDLETWWNPWRRAQSTGTVTIGGSVAGRAYTPATGSAPGTVTIGGTAAGHAHTPATVTGTATGAVTIGGSAVARLAAARQYAEVSSSAHSPEASGRAASPESQGRT